ncbi:hypothetical protein X975_18821, partial [Stegodyphus mimosarum]
VVYINLVLFLPRKIMIEGSFNWRSYLSRPNFVAAPVSCFNH